MPSRTVLVVSPGDEVYRRYCLEQVAAGYKVVIVTDSQPTWQTPLIADWEVTDLTDPGAVVSMRP